MGTNFYWELESCEHCGRSTSVHVGKRSAGWSFGFRGYRHDPDNGLYSPLGFTVASRADWARVFADPHVGPLTDEYSVVVLDARAWLAGLDPPTLHQQMSESEWMGPHWRPGDPSEWRDAEGFRFNDREFS